MNHNHRFEKKKMHLVYQQMCHLGDRGQSFLVEENGDVGEEAFLAMEKKTLLHETTSKESEENGFLDDRFFPLKTNVFVRIL